jgi:hypothetical protein
MESPSGRRWLIAAVALFLLLLTGWVLLALQLSAAQAGLLPYGPGLSSRLSSDYGPDPGGRPIAVISLSILEDAMQALGLSDDEARAMHDSMELAMSQPVPTATALDFDGSAPFTATPTRTNTPPPTATSTSTPVPTNTRRPPTHTPKPSNTPKPTNPPSTSAPTATPGGGDTTDPQVASFSVSPTPGTLAPGVCTISATVRITDASPSSGIDVGDVGMKYDDPYGPGYIYSYNMVLVSGGPDGSGGWDATYSGSITFTGITVSLQPGSTKLASLALSSSQEIDVWFIFEDLAGNVNFRYIGEYELVSDCP